MTKPRAIAIAAIVTFIFGSVAIGISANMQSNNNTSDAVVTDLVSPSTSDAVPATDASSTGQAPAEQQLTNVVQAYEDDDHEGDAHRGHNNDEDHGGRDHEEDD